MKKWTFKPKRLMRYIAVNGGALAAFIIGNLYDIAFMRLIGELMFWAASIMAIIVSIVSLLLKKSKGSFWKEAYLVKDVDKKELEEINKKVFDDGILILNAKGFEDIVDGSVPHKVDILYDVIVAAIMVAFNYAWLPLFYIVHILLLDAFKRDVNRFIEKDPYLTLEEVKEKFLKDGTQKE